MSGTRYDVVGELFDISDSRSVECPACGAPAGRFCNRPQEGQFYADFVHATRVLAVLGAGREEAGLRPDEQIEALRAKAWESSGLGAGKPRRWKKHYVVKLSDAEAAVRAAAVRADGRGAG